MRALIDEQASLRRMAMLVAQAPPAAEVFAAVTDEAASLLDVPIVSMARFERDGTATVIAASRGAPFPVGANLTLDGPSVIASILETGRSATIDDYSGLTGVVAEGVRGAGVETAVGSPIVVDRRTWGAIVAVAPKGRQLPADTEGRLGAFTELVATGIANAEARDDLRRLADEQAALRRVATLVAQGATPAELFTAVALEVAQVLEVPAVMLERYEPDATVTVLAAEGLDGFPVGSRWPLDGPSLAARVLETGRPERIEDYGSLTSAIAEVAHGAAITSAVAAPIIVDGQVWGLISVGTKHREPLIVDTEARLGDFTALVATAISNATARTELIDSRARIVAAGDEARRRIERNLHDGIQQRLIALGLDLQAVAASIPSDQQEARAGLEQVDREIGSVLEEVRELSRGLHPALLSRGGLGPSLRALGRKSPIRVDLDVDADERPPEPVEIGVYYVVSEALTNAAKHSQASEILVSVRAVGAALQATIVDDGVGGADISAGTGLIGLIDRVEALGGRLTLDSPPGGGTKIAIELPLASRAPGEG